jgi:hypothetical protein
LTAPSPLAPLASPWRWGCRAFWRPRRRSSRLGHIDSTCSQPVPAHARQRSPRETSIRRERRWAEQ